jgi:hypothetical protein
MKAEPVESAGRPLLRHTLATLAYRGGKTLRGSPPGFGAFRVAEGTRTPEQILAHIGDLLDWALGLARGRHAWKDSAPLPWEREVERFFRCAGRLDEYLASGASLGCSAERLFQGPIADALTHVGQIAMLRRLSGAPVKGENYFKAEIAAGRVGADQAAPAFEFD